MYRLFSTFRRLSWTAGLCVLLAAPAAHAQDRPYAGLFDDEPKGERSQLFSFRVGVFSLYDENDLNGAEAASSINPEVRASGISNVFLGQTSYLRKADHASFFMDARGTLRAYNAHRDAMDTDAAARTGLTFDVGQRTTVDATAGLTYGTQFALLAFGTDAGPEGGAFDHYSSVLAPVPHMETDANVSFIGRYWKHSDLTASVTWRGQRMLDSPGPDWQSWGAHLTFNHQLTKGLGFHVGYGRELARGEQQDPSRLINEAIARVSNETIDVGLDYGGTLAIARRTSLSFSTSTSAIRFRGLTQFRLNGHASLNHPMGRTWLSWLSYSRDAGVSSAFREPVLSDSADAGLAGRLTGRVKWTGRVSYSYGQVGLATSYGQIGLATDNHMEVLHARSRLEVALSRLAGMYAEYGYYRDQLPGTPSVLLYLPSQSQHTAAVGVTLWVPISDDARAPSDSR